MQNKSRMQANNKIQLSTNKPNSSNNKFSGLYIALFFVFPSRNQKYFKVLAVKFAVIDRNRLIPE